MLPAVRCVDCTSTCIAIISAVKLFVRNINDYPSALWHEYIIPIRGEYDIVVDMIDSAYIYIFLVTVTLYISIIYQ